MLIVDYFKNSFARKKARRVFKEYGFRVDTFELEGEKIEFANWLNPLVKDKKITAKEIHFFKQYIPVGSFAVDIGANIGDLTVPMAIAAGEKGMVLGLDPNPMVFKILQANSRLNPHKTNIIPLQLAAVENECQYYFASSEASMGNGGLIERLDDDRHGKFKLKDPIQGVNLVEYLKSHYANWLPKLSLIKIDAEGFDYFILKTLEPLLEKYHPVIIAEVFHLVTKEVRNNIYSLLKKYNYTILNIGEFETDENFQPKLIKDQNEMPKYGITENIIAFCQP